MKQKTKNESFFNANNERTRSANIECKSVINERALRLAFSSETPVFRGDRWEVLVHNPNDCADLCRINNGAPLLFNHHADNYIGAGGETLLKFLF